MAFTEFYVQTTGSNLNSGSSTSDAADHTYAGGTFVRATGVFTVAAGDPASDGVAVGNFASIYTTAGATVATFIGRVTARDATTITVSLTAIAGAVASVSEGAGEATCKVGGAWDGPSGAVGFPFGFADGTLMDAAGNRTRVNWKNGTTYSITAAIVHNFDSDVLTFQGYTTNPGDGGKVIIDGGVDRAYYILLTLDSSCKDMAVIDFIFAHNGNSGSAADGVLLNGTENCLIRCVFHDIRRQGVRVAGNNALIECEAYACNQANTANFGAIGLIASGAVGIRCYSHDNTGANVDGFAADGGIMVLNCISHSNGRHGVSSTANVNATYIGCDFYNNGGSGINLGAGATDAMLINIQNCNFVKNGAWGINFGNQRHVGTLYNCGFGAGTQANVSGNLSTELQGLDIVGTITYPNDVTPWVDPANGDFRINLAQAKHTGRGAFTQTDTGESARNTVAYPDVGAAQHQNQLSNLGTSGSGAITKETGANARGGSGSCVKFNPGSTTAQLYWNFLVPVTAAAEFELHFWHKITAGFNGSVKVSIYDSDDDATLLLTQESVSLTDDAAYHECTSTAVTPTDTGFCRVKVEVLDGAATGDVYIDDLTVVAI